MSAIMRRAIGLTFAVLLGPAVMSIGTGLSLPSASAAEPVTVTAAADSYVDAALPTSNFGTRTSYLIDASPQQIAYLRFDIPAATDLTGGVKLRVFAQSTHTAGVTAYGVADTAWTETGITYENRPALGPASGKSGALTASTWKEIDVTSVVGSTGPVSLALQTTSNTSLRITSKEGANKPQLVIGDTTPPPPPPPPGEFLVSPVGDGTYQAVSTTATFTGTLKTVGQSAVAKLKAGGGGTVRFTSGDFDFGSEYFVLSNLTDIDFVGAGIDATIIRNNSSAAADTEPFSFTGTNRVKVREMTIVAAGSARTSSDALDFDKGNNSLVENVKITGSRSRGIVFDGKDAGATAENNVVRGCQISGIPGAAVQFLASSRNTVAGCTISGTGGPGIYAQQSSSTAAQPNKKSSDNTFSNNTIDQAGGDGVYISNGDRNSITNNTITNSSDRVASRDGIRITSVVAGLTCDDNSVSGNTATDNQATKTQSYGLNIASALCNRTVVGSGNNFAGNRLGPIRDVGTATVYQGP
ncbi:right-handed parallel beta-helix repeat-containing protein [Blastococcus sp. CT_GayMR19]|uniref:CBM96 family carbohydrate-binding protein n=1 Tax=Blastococcus sp. CT_GayMR19 TaxID=2559608 RepID=UPI001073EEE2|nr:right-handed parallel beta-helix repeat-containing protein [Blastococcus sp. CT_GayMR19]TFV74835.1 right-handed parallel beta-helix repeat-containing protein [Blastococcus sp. CT_GayMR19]